MHYYSIPSCYFPSTALFIDDSRDFLLNFVLHLDEGLAYRMFDSPFDACEYIQKNHGELEKFSERCKIESLNDQKSHRSTVAENKFAAIHKEMYNPRRFAEISVVVVDYAMPGMDGIEFCRRIADTNIKRILLTGKADEKIAIQAFNEGVIHRYIHKSDPSAAELITRSIYELQWQYFQLMSETIIKSLSLTVPQCLNDKKFAEFFLQFRQNKNNVEYYLVDSAGSFLFLDDDAKTSYLIVKSHSDLQTYYRLAQAKGVQQSTLNQLLNGEKIPGILQNRNDSQLIDWSSCLLHAERIHSEMNYHYAYVQDNQLLDLDKASIFSYHSYLEEVDAEELLML